MKYVAAFLLAQLGGNASPSQSDISKILSSVGIEVDTSRVGALLAEVSGKSSEELISAGSTKLASMPSAGAVAAPTAASASAAKTDVKAAAPAKVESEEEEMGFGLFD